jgi:hypothetical protein
MLGVLSESSAIWAALATKTASAAPQIALHSATSSRSGLPYRHQEHLDALIEPLQLVGHQALRKRDRMTDHFRSCPGPLPRTGQSSFQGSEIETGQPNGVGKTG